MDFKNKLPETSCDCIPLIYSPQPAFPKPAMLHLQETQNLPRQKWEVRDWNANPVTATSSSVTEQAYQFPQSPLCKVGKNIHDTSLVFLLPCLLFI